MTKGVSSIAGDATQIRDRLLSYPVCLPRPLPGFRPRSRRPSGLNDRIRRQVLGLVDLAVGVVPGSGPRGKQQQQARVLERSHGMALAGLELDERPGTAAHGFASRLDVDLSRNEVHEDAFTHLVVAHFLAGA